MKKRRERATFRDRFELMVKTLREEILSGERRAEEFLPAEPRLAERFQLSKTSVRKALDQLAGEGYVTTIPRVGTKVAKPEGDKPVTLTFGYYRSLAHETNMDALIERFHEHHPHIRIECIRLPHPDSELLLHEMIGKRLADVMTLNLPGFDAVCQHDELLRELAPAEPSGEEYPFLTRAFIHRGTIYAAPFVFSPVVLCYNKEHFREADLAEPDSGWTWDELKRAAERLANGRQRLGFGFHVLSTNRWPIFLLQSGYAFRSSEDGHRQERLREAVRASRELMRVPADMPYLSESDSDLQALFEQGKASMILATYFTINALRDKRIDFDLAPLPALREATTLLLAVGLAIHAGSPRQEAARTFVRFMQSREAQLFIRQTTLSIPAHRKAADGMAEKKTGSEPSRYHMFRDIIPTFRTVRDLQLNQEQLLAARRELALFWSGLEELSPVAERLENRWASMLQQTTMKQLSGNVDK
ncbi:hypothetical protein J31TS4_29980 [Paenibacillus sp. J31TS4]|uniref:extracellular solute-binding protein n=1 Tax=Paenibacillus sp. J31TS4 TaxID=2807195 RepID=UPI001B1FDE23|nr:extracellular solute-binding protein [Paenibacillus sp. J31TS4]GIP39718.1 hypothetical protein J31TS4_29980 [Paenibacillus sp. J31TS4]